MTMQLWHFQNFWLNKWCELGLGLTVCLNNGRWVEGRFVKPKYTHKKKIIINKLKKRPQDPEKDHWKVSYIQVSSLIQTASTTNVTYRKSIFPSSLVFV